MNKLKGKKIVIAFLVGGLILVSICIYCISNAQIYTVFLKRVDRSEKNYYDEIGMSTEYYYEINFITNTITSYSGKFGWGGIETEPRIKIKLGTKFMSIAERIELKKILKEYDADSIIYADDSLMKFIIY